MSANQVIQLKLTPEQIELFRPLHEQAEKNLTPDLIFAQVRRLHWTEGAHLVLEVALLQKHIVEGMLAGMRSAKTRELERIAKEEAKRLKCAARAEADPEGQEEASTRTDGPNLEPIETI